MQKLYRFLHCISQLRGRRWGEVYRSARGAGVGEAWLVRSRRASIYTWRLYVTAHNTQAPHSTVLYYIFICTQQTRSSHENANKFQSISICNNRVSRRRISGSRRAISRSDIDTSGGDSVGKAGPCRPTLTLRLSDATFASWCTASICHLTQKNAMNFFVDWSNKRKT